MFRIVHKRQLSEAVFEMGVEAPTIARKVRAGQFLMLRVDEARRAHPAHLLRLVRRGGLDPLHLHARRQDHARAVAPRGRATTLADVVGPLGVPTHTRGLGRVAVVGGGVGAAVAYPVARAMAAAGNDVTVILGARNAELLVLEDELRALPLRELVVVHRRRLGGQQGPRDAPLKRAVRGGRDRPRRSRSGPRS